MLFHLHFHTPGWETVEHKYCEDLGFRVYARHGANGERWGPEISWADLARMEAKVRLTDLVAGRVNIVLGPASADRKPFMEHLGVVMPRTEVDRAMERAAALGWRVNDRSERRLFVQTPFGFRVELAPREAWVERWGNAAHQPALAEVTLAADDPNGAAASLARMLGYETVGGDAAGPETRLRFVDGPGRAGVLVGYRLAGVPFSEQADPCGALVSGEPI